MKAEQLHTRIEKTETKIEKINKRIIKWSKHLDSNMIDAVKTSLDKTYREATALINAYSSDYDRCYEAQELRGACRDLRDAELLLDKYRNQLKIVEDKQNADRIDTLVQFLNKWKEEMTAYVNNNAKTLTKIYELKDKQRAIYNDHYYSITFNEADEFNAEYKNIDKQVKVLNQSVYPLTSAAYDYKSRSIKADTLSELLTDEAERKYWILVEQITKYTGEITDAEGLYVSSRGTLDGVVDGKKGSARVETIWVDAGREFEVNPETGRHGQCPHYRTLVKAL